MIVPCNNYSLNHQSVWTSRLNMPSLRAVYTEAVYQTVEPLKVKQAKGKMYDYLRKEQSLVLQIFFGKKKHSGIIYYVWGLPGSPVFCPHFWLIILVRRKPITVEIIASVYLSNENLFRKDVQNHSKISIAQFHLLTIGSGALACLHIIHGTVMLRPIAIWAAHCP